MRRTDWFFRVKKEWKKRPRGAERATTFPTRRKKKNPSWPGGGRSGKKKDPGHDESVFFAERLNVEKNGYPHFWLLIVKRRGKEEKTCVKRRKEVYVLPPDEGGLGKVLSHGEARAETRSSWRREGEKKSP